MLRSASYGMLALLAISACAARARGPSDPLPGERYVGDVRLEGNESLSGKWIKIGLASRAPRGWIHERRTRFDPAVVRKDRARIETYYKKRGFFDARVVAVDVDRADEERTDLTFRIREGAPSMTTNVIIEGAPQDPRADLAALRRASRLETDIRFDYEEFYWGKFRILKALLRAGYGHAKVTGRAEADRKKHSVVLRYTVDAGPRVRFGEVEIAGLKTIPESAVRNRLAFSKGDTFNPKKIAATQSRLRSLGRFGVVRVDFKNNKRTPVSDVKVTVSEGPRRELRLGGGVGIDSAHWEIRGRAGYTLHGFLDPLTTLTTDARPAYAFIRGSEGTNGFVAEATAELSRVDFLLPLVRGRAALAYNVDVVEAYSSQGPRARLGLSRPLWDHRLNVGLGWRFELVHFFRIADAIDDTLRSELGLSTPYRLGFFEQSIALDLRDDPLNARSGVYAEVRLEEGRPEAGSEFKYAKVTPEARGYLPVAERLVLAARVRLGYGIGGTIPISRRYFAGGASSQRGFSQRRLSPVAGDPETSTIGIGGDRMLDASAEARLGLLRLGDSWLGVVAFVDAGDVTMRSEQIDPLNLHIASGGGLRYQTPVGPLRFDVGYRLTRYGAGELFAGDRVAFHLSIGEAF